jgi:hypothetical protein
MIARETQTSLLVISVKNPLRHGSVACKKITATLRPAGRSCQRRGWLPGVNRGLVGKRVKVLNEVRLIVIPVLVDQVEKFHGQHLIHCKAAGGMARKNISSVIR